MCKTKFKAGDYLIDKYADNSDFIFIKSVVDAGTIDDKSSYIVDYCDGNDPVIRSVEVIQKYYKLPKG